MKINSVMMALPEFPNVNKEAALIKIIIRKSENETIPQSKIPLSNNSPVWFNSSIAKLIKDLKGIEASRMLYSLEDC